MVDIAIESEAWRQKNVANSLYVTIIEILGDIVLYNGDRGDCPFSGDSIQPHDLGLPLILSHCAAWQSRALTTIQLVVRMHCKPPKYAHNFAYMQI